MVQIKLDKNKHILLFGLQTRIFVFLLLVVSTLYSQPNIPTLGKYATDQTNTISDAEINQIDNELKKFDDKTSNQVVFLMIGTLEDYPIEMYTNEVAEKNKIGTKENDNGVLFCVVKNDRKMRIEVGYGLEGALPDALASSIIRNEVAPYFKKDDYYSGIVAGLNAILSVTMGEYTRTDKHKEDDEGGRFPFGYLIFIILILIFGRGKGGLGGLLLLGALGGGGRGGYRGGGGGFGGGGFSGGGGSFGGGGASGGW